MSLRSDWYTHRMPGQSGLHTDRSQGPLITIKIISYSPELILVLNHLLMQYVALIFRAYIPRCPEIAPKLLAVLNPIWTMNFSHVIISALT